LKDDHYFDMLNIWNPYTLICLVVLFLSFQTLIEYRVIELYSVWFTLQLDLRHNISMTSCLNIYKCKIESLIKKMSCMFYNT